MTESPTTLRERLAPTSVGTSLLVTLGRSFIGVTTATGFLRAVSTGNPIFDEGWTLPIVVRFVNLFLELAMASLLYSIVSDFNENPLRRLRLLRIWSIAGLMLYIAIFAYRCIDLNIIGLLSGARGLNAPGRAANDAFMNVCWFIVQIAFAVFAMVVAFHGTRLRSCIRTSVSECSPRRGEGM